MSKNVDPDMIPNHGYPYLNNTKADHRLIGVAPLISPFADKVSSQRGMMMTDHVGQAIIVDDVQMDRCFTGYESKIGKYSYDPTARDHDVQIIAVIPKYLINESEYPLKYNPKKTVIYRDMVTNEIGCFYLDDFIMRNDDYGYLTKSTGISVNPGMIIAKDDVLLQAPTHEDEDTFKIFGTNLNVAYMAVPQVTEDGIVISESAAERLGSTGVNTITIDIKMNQLPLNLYGNEAEYKFIPDVGDMVREDGILCALRSPNADSIIHDTSRKNLSRIQYLHDRLFRIPAGSQIVDIDVRINRRAKPISTIKNDILYHQAEVYRQKLNTYCRSVYNIYQEVHRRDESITDGFNTLVHDCLGHLFTAGERLDGVANIRKPGVVQPVKSKEIIEFISIKISYIYKRKVQCGFKLAGRYGNKGVVSCIKPDNEMPIDADGFRADMIIDPVSVFNRMNPGQWYEQFFNRGNELLRRRVTEVVRTTNDYERAWQLMIDWANDINPNYAEHLEATHPSAADHRDLVEDTIRKGFFLQINPFQNNINQDKILELSEKYDIHAKPVQFVVVDENGNKRTVVSKEPVIIGEMFVWLLYKVPHMHACGVGYVNNFRTPVKSKDKISSVSPYSVSAIRFGEDEIRNIIATAGGETAARIVGLYGNNKQAVDTLLWKQLTDKNPARIKNIGIPTKEIVKGNNIVNVTKHMFSCFGIDINEEE